MGQTWILCPISLRKLNILRDEGFAPPKRVCLSSGIPSKSPKSNHNGNGKNDDKARNLQGFLTFQIDPNVLLLIVSIVYAITSQLLSAISIILVRTQRGDFLAILKWDTMGTYIVLNHRWFMLIPMTVPILDDKGPYK